MRWSPNRPGALRIFGACLLTVTMNMTTFPLLALPADGAAESRFGQEGSVKVRVTNSRLAEQAKSFGARVVADYESFRVLEVPRHATGTVAALVRDGGGELLLEENLISLNSEPIDTTQRAAKDRMGVLATFGGKGLHLVQFAGPIKPEWYAALAATGVRIVNYIPANAYMVYGDSSQLAAVAALKNSNPFVQWDGAYEGAAKLHKNIGERQKAQAGAKPGTPAETLYSIQMVEDAAVNADTLALLENLKAAGTNLHVWKFLGFVNVKGDFAAGVLDQIAARPEVVSIQASAQMRKMDERQAQIMAGNLTAGIPNPASYSTQLATWGFTQAQFNTSGFAVDITDDGLDNGLTNVNNPQFHEAGLYANTTRVLYNGIQNGATFNTPGRNGVDGHGNLNTGIVGGFVPVAFGAAFPHGDSLGFRYGQGIAPFVKLAHTCIFNSAFTNPSYPDMLSRGYNSGARISSNSWGAPVSGAYNTDSQAYDALVRDAQPTGSAFPAAGNQEMVIVFSAGNDGSVANSIGSPGTAKNVFTIGAAENVHSHATAAGGNNASGNDGCNIPDTGANDANDIIDFSSRGPCDDGRVKPDIQAPGTHVTGQVWQNTADPANNGFPNGTSPLFEANVVCALPGGGTAGDPDNFFPLGQQWYSTSSGTSHSCPAVAGASALVRQYFINQAWGAPSPAMNKAFLINSTRYMTGVSANDTLPSNSQGMGEVNLGTAFDGVARVRSDQVGAMKFTASGQTRTFVGTVQDGTKPFRVTLAWTDAPGNTVGNAYNNNLDLSVTVGGNTYLGNVFSGANSTTGGSADVRNNVESVFVPAGLAAGTSYVVTVTGTNINSNGVPNDADPLDQDFALVIYNAAAASVPVVGITSSTLTAESCAPPNSAPDPAETVTYDICLQNVGTANTTSLVGTLQATGGVTSPSAAQNYGVLVAGGAAVCRAFSFTVDPGVTCGNSITMSLQLQDGLTNLGTATSTKVTGTLANFASQNFDGVTPPALPAGWTASNAAGAAPLWVSAINGGGFGSDTAPNAAFVDDPASVSDKRLDYAVTLPAGQSQLTFRHRYDLESGFDGGVLEISINGGAFADIVAAGGSFVSGGYTATISTGFSSPIAGRSAWTGNSGAYVTTTVNLPLAAQGLPVVLRFRMGSDSSASYPGWAVDTVSLVAPQCTCVASPPLISETGFAWQPGETCTPANGAPDPNETVTYRMTLQNNGGSATSNLVVTLQGTGGVVAPVARTYGAIAPGGSAFRDFTFQISNSVICGANVTATFALADGALTFPNIVHVLTTGTTASSGPTAFSNPAAITIPASGAGTPYPSPINVSGLTGTVSKVTVGLTGFTHTFPDDVDVLLVGPGGQNVMLMSDVGGSTDVTNLSFVFDDAAAASLPDSSVLSSGTFKPTNIGATDTMNAPAPAPPYGATLSVLNGSAPNGTWNLYVRDQFSPDSGTLSGGWTLNITTSSPVCSTTCTANQAPTVTPTPGGITVPRGATTNLQIATVTDTDTAPPTLVFSVPGATAGLMLSNAVLTPTVANTWAVTADVFASCTALPTGETATLQAYDGTNTVQATLNVNTTANAAGATLTGGATLCAGESTTLSVALTGTGPWSLTWSDGFIQSGITTSPATRVVSPAVTTTYTITAVSGANGCAGAATGSALVTVNPRPTGTVSGGGTICAGTSSVVSVALTGTAPWTITWNDGMVQIAGASPATRTVSPTFNQAFSVVSLSDSKCAGGTSTGIAAFVVKPVPSAVITAADGVCFSSTGNVASVPDGGAGTTYAWAITGGTITAGTGTNSVTFTANASGNVVLTVTVTKDGCPNVGTKTIPIQTLPSAPVPMIPSNGSTYSGAFVSWTHAGGTYYDVYLDTVNPPEKLIFSGQTNNFEAFIPSWVSGVTYYWKVVARNGCGSVPSSVQSFVAGSCPWTGAAPTLTSPANGATGVGSTATLVWTPVAGTAHYDVYLGTSSGSLTRYDVVEAPQNSVAVPVSPGVTYFWKVVAVPVCGSAAVATSSTNSFATAGAPFGATGFAPSFFNRWDTGTVTLTGSGFTSGMQLFTDFQDAEAGTLVPAIFTNSFSNPTQLQATLIGNPAAPAGRYDVGVTVSGLEEGRLLQAMALRAFTDVTENDYYYLSSARMADAGIMEADFSSGTPGPQYMPNTNVPRALMAEYLAKSYQFWRYRSTGLPSATCTPSGAGSTDFPDVACSHPNWLAIHWIKAWGVTQGSPCAQGLCFNPNNNVTRAEMVTFIERLRQTGVLNTLLSTVGETDPGCAVAYPACKGWTDAGGAMDVAGWPRREANVAFVDRITAGCSGTPGSNLKFCPNDAVTRAQIGEFLARTLGLVPMP